MSGDSISRKAVIDEMYDLIEATERLELQIVDVLERVSSEMPSAEKTGKWIRHPIYEGSDHYYYACSECDYRSWSKDNFCSVCGAKMGGKNE